jgi:hypothetical protein
VTNEVQQQKQSYRGTGNRCGHKPEKPRIPSLPTGQYRPNPIIELAMGLIPFAHNADFFPEIDNTNGSKRHMRSELGEACLMLAAALFYYYDSVSRAVAIPTNDGTLVVKSMAFFALIAGLEIRRAWRAFKSLLGSKFFYREGKLIKVSLNYFRRLEDLTGKKVLMALEALAKKISRSAVKRASPPSMSRRSSGIGSPPRSPPPGRRTTRRPKNAPGELRWAASNSSCCGDREHSPEGAAQAPG